MYIQDGSVQYRWLIGASLSELHSSRTAFFACFLGLITYCKWAQIQIFHEDWTSTATYTLRFNLARERVKGYCQTVCALLTSPNSLNARFAILLTLLTHCCELNDFSHQSTNPVHWLQMALDWSSNFWSTLSTIQKAAQIQVENMADS